MNKNIKVLFSSNINPNFKTFTEYIEDAFKANGCDTLFFENRDFVIPGRIRDKIKILHKVDLKLCNNKLLRVANTYKPDFFLEAGGWNILPSTLDSLKKKHIKTILWTNDPPFDFKPIMNSAPYYDYIFTQGTEAYEIFEKLKIKNLHWMPFACDPKIHKPVTISDTERVMYGCDVSFVGSGWPGLNNRRIGLLESLAEFNLGIWGPGWHNLSVTSPIKSFVRGGQTKPDEWIKIYSASKISFCSHHHDPSGKVPCYQASPRVFEVMACGTMLMCDDQPDVRRLFMDGEHLVIYRDIDELREKVSYYLEHEDERKRIAENGMREVLEKHTFTYRVKAILDILGCKCNVSAY